MVTRYIPRTLLADRETPNERLVTEDEIATFQVPLIVLGDPGLGKTELTKSLQTQLGAVRTTGGTFYRNEDPKRFDLASGTSLIIDGLDEITTSSGGSVVDEVLKKLSRIGNPRFILSCRSADWQGSTDRYKIRSDYGVEPITLLLQPFSYQDAIQFLSLYDASIDAEHILRTLSDRGLGDFFGNPLTLTLIAELVVGGQGLPESRSDLFMRASTLLLEENNEAHRGSWAAQFNIEEMLDSAGAIFALLLLSGSLGPTARHRDDAPAGYVPLADLNDIPRAPLISATLKTRLFRSVGENLFIPFHRVIAEFLGARWLSKRLSDDGLSERRVLQSLTFADGVPSALRGLHAWLAHFNPSVADRCIRTDPYGVLRYGEPDKLPTSRARLLLHALASLANEDPYFRSEDWGKRAVAGLARPELKDQIVELIKSPDRHFQLSALILEALPGSSLTNDISPELVTIIHDSNAAYVERINAAQALIDSNTNIDWSSAIHALRSKSGNGNKRLSLEIISHVRGKGFTGVEIADALLEYEKSSSSEEETYVSGVNYVLVNRIPTLLCAEVLDRIAHQVEIGGQPNGWRAKSNLSTTVHHLAMKAIEGVDALGSERLWSWLRILEDQRGYSSRERERIRDFLRENTKLRHEIQTLAFSDRRIDGAPWMAIVHVLPAISDGLALTTEDAAGFLLEIAKKDDLSNFDIDLWASLVRSKQTWDGFQDVIEQTARAGTERHEDLRRQWEELTAPPKRDWRKEEEVRQSKDRRDRLRLYGKHRENFLSVRDKIESGTELGALFQLANAYLNRYTDLNHDAEPVERLREWLGNDLTDAAVSGFVAVLSRDDLPTTEQISKSHAEGKQWNFEPVMTCGIIEMVRTHKSLTSLPRDVTTAVLASWWEGAAFDSDQLHDETEKQLENAVFSSDEAVEEFLAAVMEPRIRAKDKFVPGLYRLPRDDRFKRVAGRLALQWLRKYPDAISATQWELLETAIEHAPADEVTDIINARLATLSGFESEVRTMWMAAAFLMDFPANRKILSTFCDENPKHLWSLRSVIRPDRSGPQRPITLQQLEFIVCKFAHRWPPAGFPLSSWGDTNPWDASNFIRSCITEIGSDFSEEASLVLEQLAEEPGVVGYVDHIKHVRAQQRRLRRDKEFRVPSFSEIKNTLAGGLPGNIDDLKALTLDRLESVQDYLRNGDTRAYEAFWNGEIPKNENTCRDRLLDALRPRVPSEINLLPETIMPDANRADIVVIHHAEGVPIEIKGQWHSEVWDAASVQLIEKYTRDWRAYGRGIYLVLWFGNVPAKQLPKHPNLIPLPSSPTELRVMLEDRLSEAERSRIDIFVLDVSRP